MVTKLTDAVVKSLPVPATGNKIRYDTDLKGFGCRVTAAGARAFVLNFYTRSGRERRITIGSYPEWKVSAARKEAELLKQRVDRGEDPLADLEADRGAKTMAHLCERYIEQHLPKKRPSSQVDDRSMIEREILPVLKHLKVVDVTYSDVDGVHRRISKRGKKHRANRVVALLSKMFSLSIRWGWRTDNPALGIERNPEAKRDRYLSGAELERLTKALAEYGDQEVADIIRLLLLTGARRGEVLGMRWDNLDLETGIWTKPGATTKQKTVHRVPLSAPARQLLVDLQQDADDEFVFHRDDIKRQWESICRSAEITGARVHDLRHTYASLLASSGLSLPVIGALLGHTQAQTTSRYAHLLDDPLRRATETVGSIIVPSKKPAVVTRLRRG